VKQLVRRWLRRPPINGRHPLPRDTVSAILKLQATPTAELVLNPRSPADKQLVRVAQDMKIITCYGALEIIVLSLLLFFLYWDSNSSTSPR